MLHLERQKAKLTSLECWAPAPGFEGIYEVSDLGRVRRIAKVYRGKPAGPLTPTRRPDGYYVVSFYRGGRGKPWLMHRLVLTAFRGPQPEGKQGAHLNGDKADNRLANLAWVTCLENAHHKIIHGKTTEGEKNGWARITAATVRAIRAECRPRSRTHGCGVIAAKYGLSMQHVWDIVKGNVWKHI